MNDAMRAQTISIPAGDGAAALAGWQRIVSWFSRHLSADPAAQGTP